MVIAIGVIIIINVIIVCMIIDILAYMYICMYSYWLLPVACCLLLPCRESPFSLVRLVQVVRVPLLPDMDADAVATTLHRTVLAKLVKSQAWMKQTGIILQSISKDSNL